MTYNEYKKQTIQEIMYWIIAKSEGLKPKTYQVIEHGISKMNLEELDALQSSLLNTDL